MVTAVWEFEACCDPHEKALCFYSDREIRRMVRWALFLYLYTDACGSIHTKYT